MTTRTNRTTSLPAFIVLLLLAPAAFGGPVFHPFEMGTEYEYIQWDRDRNDAWFFTAFTNDTMAAKSFKYFHYEGSNYYNSGVAFDEGYLRSTEEAVYRYNASGDDYLLFQKAPIGTQWSYEEHLAEYDYRVVQVVGIESVSVPYGTFDEAYVYRCYSCVDPDNLALGVSPDTFEWLVPGVARVKEVDFWNDTGIATTAELVQVNAVPAPGAVVLAGLGVGLMGWLRKREYLA